MHVFPRGLPIFGASFRRTDVVLQCCRECGMSGALKHSSVGCCNLKGRGSNVK